MDTNAYSADQATRGLLRFLTCGSVDDGKSTLIGRLLYDSQLIMEDQLSSLEKRLASPGFTSKAKPEVVESERAKLVQWTARREQLAALGQSLGGA